MFNVIYYSVFTINCLGISVIIKMKYFLFMFIIVMIWFISDVVMMYGRGMNGRGK